MSTGSSSHNGASSLAPRLGPAAPLSPLTNSSRESKGTSSARLKRKGDAPVSVCKSPTASSASLAAGGGVGPRLDIKKMEGGKRGGAGGVGYPMESTGNSGGVALKRSRTAGNEAGGGGGGGAMPAVQSGLRDRVKGNERALRADSPQLPPFKRSKMSLSETAVASVGGRKGEVQAVNSKVSSISKNEQDRGGSAHVDTTSGAGGGRYSSSSRLKRPNKIESAGTTPLPISSASPSPSLSAPGASRSSSSNTQHQQQQQAHAGKPPAQAPKIKTLKSYLTNRDSPGATSTSSPSESSTGSIASANGGTSATAAAAPASSTVNLSALDTLAAPPPPRPLTGKNLAEWILRVSFSRAGGDAADGPSATVLAVSNDPKSYGSGRGVDFLMREVLYEIWRNVGHPAPAREDVGLADGSVGGRHSKRVKVFWEWCDLLRDVEDGEEVETVSVPYRSGSVRVEEGIPRDERNCVWFVWVLGCALFNDQRGLGLD
ncbi:hypothetical protein BC830DRAFT_592940 [Chytriomyces sp. MP71]|nr:hypothetical protein BC830DRAFT_592940 [Chytriomyces sp. MP71]